MTGQIDQWQNLAQQLRINSIRCSTAAGSGHPTSALSAADLMAVLMTSYLRYDFDQPDHPNNDHLIFSKGHASALLYAMYRAAGVVSDDELLRYRTFGSRLQGHPTPVIPWVDVATGSLGQGLPIGVGTALVGQYLEQRPYRTWVLLGDSEMAEGSIWEALNTAGHYRLQNLIGILDMNRLGQRGPTILAWDSATYAARIRAFGWHAIEVDGHDFEEIQQAYTEALQPREQPTLIIAKTKKGRGVSFLEDKNGKHGKTLTADEAKQAFEDLGGQQDVTVAVQKPEPAAPITQAQTKPIELPKYEVGTKVATRQAYGEALCSVGAARPTVIALDGEVSNSTFAEKFGQAYPDRFFEMYIAEQQLVATAVGLSVRHYIPYASTFAAFFARAYDFIRMAAISKANIRLSGSHAGVSIGEDGPSQMALEDLAMMQAIHGSTVLYPSDANQTAHLVNAMADLPGISYIRTTREKTPVIYNTDEQFPIGGSKIVHQSDQDVVTVVAAGITVFEALDAYEILQKEGIAIRVIDAYSVKPIDQETLHNAVQKTNGKLIVVEDHWPEGGLGSAVLAALTTTESNETPHRFIHLAVQDMPGSGTPAELLDAAGISTKHIVNAVHQLVS
ncbi:MAG: transketolase [Chloroflexota bacterium]